MSDAVLERLVQEVVALRARVNALEVQESGGGGSGGWPVALDPLLYCAYDGPRPFETDFSGNPHGHLGQVATATGGVIYRPGAFGKGVQVAEATTNLLRNPSVEINTTYWNSANDGDSPTRERSALAAWIGTYGLRWVLGTSPDTYPYLWQYTGAAPAQGQAYTGGIWVRGVGAAIGKAVYVRLAESGGATGFEYSSGDPVTLSSEWQRLTMTRTILQADRTNLRLSLHYAGRVGEAGDEVHTDGWQVEQKAYPTPYLDGSLGAGHSWSGTAHASTSSRTAAQLSYKNVLNPLAGTISFMVYARDGYIGGLDTNHYFVSSSLNPGGSPCANTLSIRARNDNVLDFWTVDSAGNSGPLSWSLSELAEGWHHVAITWQATSTEAGTKALYVDGALKDSASDAPLPGALADTMWVGHWNGAMQANTVLDDLVILDRALSADEVRAIYESNAPLQVGLWGPGFLGPARTPASSTAPGQPGEVAWDGSYIYICTAPNTWRRAALSAF